MEAKMEKIETNLIKLEVKVEAGKFNDALKKAYNKGKMHFNVQGFRKGKVPMAMVKKMYGIEVLYDDAINFIIEETYPVAIQENNIRAVDYPKVEIVEVGENKDLIYTAEVTIFPEVNLGEYKGLEVKKPVYEVKEEDIQKQIQEMQEKNSRVEVKTEGTVEDKNIAVIDFKGFVDEVAFEGGEGTDYPLEIGSGSFIDDFEEQLIGATVGEEKEIKVKFPADYGKDDLNGKDATFKVTVKEIKIKEFPVLDDEFAKESTEFDTLEELKADIRKKLQDGNEEKAERELEEAVISAAVDNATIELPQVMIEKEIDNMVKDLENRLKYQGLTLEQYMEYTGNNVEKMRDYMRENAERKVRADLVLEAISKSEEIQATDEELKEKALEVAKMYSASEHEKMADILVNAQKDMLQNDIIIGKTIKFLVDNLKAS